jgi:hypothetical protein
MPQKFIFFKFFRNVKHVLNNDLIMGLQRVRCFTNEESSAGHAVNVAKVAKCKQSGLLYKILIHDNYTNRQQSKRSKNCAYI